MTRMAAMKKTWLIDPDLVQRAKKICGARTQTETVTKALQEMVRQDEIDRAFRSTVPNWQTLRTCFTVQFRRKADETTFRYECLHRI